MEQIEDLNLFSALYVFMERFGDHALLCCMFADEAGLFNQFVVNCQIRRHMAPPLHKNLHHAVCEFKQVCRSKCVRNSLNFLSM
jgi:hypothetical protein